ncbi:MAG: CPBP family intramembrane metalloprotease [Verrucomicrobiales bacterium]|nr:CPBP family intramembrane metalloprotease [Verrucomicrobiales bacterium]
MRPGRVLSVYVAVVFVGGALLAPWLYWLVEALADTVPGLAGLAEKPFHRYVNRAMLVLALAGMVPLLRGFGATSFGAFGLVRPAGQGWRLLGGFALGLVSLAVIAVAATVAEVRQVAPDLTAGRLASRLAGGALTAVSVSLIEEVLFRGAIFGAFRRVTHWMNALLLSSAIYAILHFLESARQVGEVQWYSGLVLLPKMLRGFTDLERVIPGFFNLTLAGALLALAYHRTGTLYFSIGLHAGWIFWLRVYGALTDTRPGASIWFWGSDRMTDGWLALPVLGLALWLLHRWLPERPQAAKPC